MRVAYEVLLGALNLALLRAMTIQSTFWHDSWKMKVEQSIVFDKIYLLGPWGLSSVHPEK